VAPIKAGHVGQLQPFRHRDDGRIDSAQREIGVGANEFGGTRQVVGGDGDVLELTRHNRLEKSGLDVRVFFQQPADLDDHCGWDQERAVKRLQEGGAAGMVLVGAVDGRNKRTVSKSVVTRSASYAHG
jgi:hypothetical protein